MSHLDDRAKRTATLHAAEKRTLEMIANGANLSDVLNELCAAIDSHSSGTSFVCLMDQAGNQLLPIAGPHLPSAFARAITPWPIGPNRGSCGTAAFTKKRVVIPDISNDPRWPDDARGLAIAHGVCAAWSEPLISKDGEVLGTFCISHSQARIPNDEDLELIEASGHIARIAIERQRSHESLTNALALLQKSEAKLRQVIDTIPTLAWCNLAHGPNEFLNKRWHEYTGLSPEESNDWAWQAAFHPDDLPPLMEKWRELLASGEAGEIEGRLRRHDGVFRWFLIRYNPFRNEQGEVTRWYATGTDIHERVRLEERTRNENLALREQIDFAASRMRYRKRSLFWTRPARRYTPTKRPWITQAALAKMCSLLTFANGFSIRTTWNDCAASERRRWNAGFHSKPKCARSGKMANTAGSSFGTTLSAMSKGR